MSLHQRSERRAMANAATLWHASGEMTPWRCCGRMPNAPFDLSEAMEEVIKLLRGELFEQHVSVQTRLTRGLPLVQGDRVQLQQGPESDRERHRGHDQHR